ncbi:MAG: hypothetical protein JO327_00435 [Nitrososphaeraceae archaeon]|nr:hypothetical protein [Nitrososphaeraceae archaeon]MBV9666574.1 hypothetical protein [Nitrososphaeraceae archaeon]
MKLEKDNNIAIFDTFKTHKNRFTGEAKRQRGIIIHLATEQSPELRTRTSIAHAIAKKHNIVWQNIYSGIFRDLDEVLIPSGIVKVEGRLPLRRGPRALQLEGVPFYELTEAGLLVASSIEELGNNRTKILESYISSISTTDENEKIMYNGFLLLLTLSPSLVYKMINEYIYAYSTGQVENIIPIDVKKLQYVISKQIAIEREFVEAFDTLQEGQKDLIKKFFKIVG